jgi:hypothetical protein
MPDIHYDPRADIITTIRDGVDSKGSYLNVPDKDSVNVKVYMYEDEESADYPFPLYILSLTDSRETLEDIGGAGFGHMAFIDVNVYVQRSSSNLITKNFMKACLQRFKKRLRAFKKSIPNTTYAQGVNTRDVSILETSQVKRYLIEVECLGVFEKEV